MNHEPQLLRARIDTPVGPLVAVTSRGKLCALSFEDHDVKAEAFLARRFGPLTPLAAPDPGGVVTVLESYLEGRLDALDGIEVDPGGTDFQRRVWAELRKIPAGTTISYGELARRVGDPKACRAVAAANGANPIAVVITCHRVRAANGALWGYGGGVNRKEWLLKHEGVPVGGSQRVLFETA